MKIRLIRFKKNEQLFFLAYGIFMFFAVLSTSLYYKYFYGTVYSFVLVTCFLLLCLNEVSNSKKMNYTTFVGLIICFVLYLLIGHANGNYFGTIALIPIFAYCGRNIDFNKIARFTFTLTFVLILFVVLSCYLGLIDNYIVYSASGRVREYLGFRYALYMPAFFFNLTALLVYRKKTGISWLSIFSMLLVNFWVFKKTDARLSFYLAVILLMVAGLIKLRPGIVTQKRIIYAVMTLSFLLAFLVMIVLMFCYSSGIPWAANINNFLGNRLYYTRNSLLTNGVSLFGNRISWVGYGLDATGSVQNNVYAAYNYVDCMYIQILQSYGIVITVAYIVIMTVALIKLYKRKEYYAIILLSFYAVHNMVDDLGLYLYYNTFWFIVVGILLKRDNKKANRLLKIE